MIAHSLGGAATTFALAYGLRAERAVFISPPADPREFLKIFGAALGISDNVRARVKKRVERRLGIPMEEMLAHAIAPTMQIPLLVIHDRDDKEVPVDVGQSIAEAWPGAELIITEGLGHQRILRDEGVRDFAVSFIPKSQSSLQVVGWGFVRKKNLVQKKPPRENFLDHSKLSFSTCFKL